MSGKDSEASGWNKKQGHEMYILSGSPKANKKQKVVKDPTYKVAVEDI